MSAEAAEQYLFFGLMLALFAAAMAVGFAAVAWKARSLRSWLPVTATVIKSEVYWGSYGRGQKWVPRFAYEYEVGGRLYTGRRMAFFRHYTGERAHELVRRHPVGSPVQVYYDPERPAESVMDREIRGSGALLLDALACACAGLLLYGLPTWLGR